VSPQLVLDHLTASRVPIVATLAPDAHGVVHNVNADTAAAALAAALGAVRLIVLTDVAGLYADWPNSTEVVERITATELAELLPSLESGMRPKMEACLVAVQSGVPQATVVDGRVPHIVLADLAGAAHGTTVVPDEGAQP
jgi:acetylglutamate kinase